MAMIIKQQGESPRPERHFKTLLEMLRQTAEEHASGMVYMFRRSPGEHVHYRTYGEFIEEVEMLGTGLLELGLAGFTMALLSENSYEWAVTYQAVINGVGVIVPLEVKQPFEEVERLLRRSQAKVLFFSPQQLEHAKALAAAGAADYFICFDTMVGKAKKVNLPEDARFLPYSEVRHKGADALAEGSTAFDRGAEAMDVDRMCALLFTSGTTDLAKGVMLSMRNICENVIAGTKSILVYPGERVLSVLPLHHTFETTAGMLIPFFYGACICINDGLRHLANNLVEWQINILVAVPLLIENIYKRIEKSIDQSGRRTAVRVMRPIARTMQNIGVNANRRMFRSVIEGLGGGLRMIVVGAAAMDKTVIRAFTDWGIEFYQGYGLTEHAPIVSVTNRFNNVIGSVGPALQGVAVKIAELSSEADGSGEILVQSPSVMLGYYQDEQATAEALQEGWLHTGDMGYLDKTGSLHITGRQKSMIVLTNGKNAFPEEIELYVNLIPGVVNSMVWGEINAREATDICLLIQLRRSELPLTDRSDEAIAHYLSDHVNFINKKMPQYKKIKYFLFTEHDFVRTGTMKVKRQDQELVIREALERQGLNMRTANRKNMDRF